MNYFLTESCQNTFVLFDCLKSSELTSEFLKKAHEILVKEKRDDTLILIDGEEKEGSFYARMVVLGLDGEIAEFCANGAKACAAYLFKLHPSIQTMYLKTKRGLHPLSQKGTGIYSVTLPSASFEWNPKFISDPTRLKGFTYVETLEPHLTIKQEMEDEELLAIGQELNQQKDLFPFGINVNAWHVLKEGEIFVKTYERGVQRLTRSCGTGSLACAAVYQKKGFIQVKTLGGPLEITLHDDSMELSGEAL